MSFLASGAADKRAFDPNREIHYAVSEEADVELRDLFAAMTTVSFVMEAEPAPGTPGLDISQFAPLVRTFARLGERLLDDCPLHASIKESAQ